MLDWVYAFNGSDVSVENLLVVVVFRLDDLVGYLESPPEPLHRWLTGLGWVEGLLQSCVQFAHAERSPVHRAKNLHVADRVETKPFWNSLLHQLDQRCRNLLRVVPLDEMEVGTRVCPSHIGHLPPANPVRIGDDMAARSLPEHFRESHNWYYTALDEVLKHRARPNGR